MEHFGFQWEEPLGALVPSAIRYHIKSTSAFTAMINVNITIVMAIISVGRRVCICAQFTHSDGLKYLSVFSISCRFPSLLLPLPLRKPPR